MILSYGQLEATVVAHLRIHPDRVATLRARIKQLQKLQFPPGVNVGRGTKMAYNGTHLFQLISAFELINVGLPAATATGMVVTNWRVFEAGYGRAIKNLAGVRSDDVFLRLLHLALEDLTGGIDRKGWTSPAYIEDRESLDFELGRDDRRIAFTSIILCASDIARSVLYAAENVSRVKGPRDDEEFCNWAVEYSDENYWMRAGGTWKSDYEDF